MRVQTRDEIGDTLVEILIAVVIMGIVVSALFASFVTASTASKANRNFVTADNTLRNFAEATKQAVRKYCVGGAPSYTVNYAALTPAHFTTTNSSANQTCPAITGAVSVQVLLVPLNITLPNGTTKTLNIDVRTP